MKKWSNRTLLVLLVILAALVAIMWIHHSRKGDRSFRRELFQIDSARVTALEIYPKGNAKGEIRLMKEGSGWKVSHNGEVYPADTNTIRNLLQAILSAMPERVAGLSRDNWADFQVTDSAGTRVVVEEDGDVTADFRVGKISFSQSREPQGYGRNRNPVIKSHLRVEGDDRVYQVDGYLSMMFNDKVSSYRDRTLCRFEKHLPTRLTFSYPGDSSFTLVKKGDRWWVNNLPADSMEVAAYLGTISASNGSEFAEAGFPVPEFPCSILIEGDRMAVIEIRGARDDAGKSYFLQSSANPTALFKATSPYLFERIFVGKGKFEVRK